MPKRRRSSRTSTRQRRTSTQWVIAVIIGLALFGSLSNSLQSGVDPVYAMFPVALVLIVAIVAFALWRSWSAARRNSGSLQALLRLNPREFERRVAGLFAAMGYVDAQVTGRADDRGADIICKDEWGRRIVIQCKRYAPSNKVTSEAVQAVAGMYRAWHNADHAIVVTTSGFTRNALETGRAAHLTLIDGEQLVRLIEKVDATLAEQPHRFFGRARGLRARPLSDWLDTPRQRLG